MDPKNPDGRSFLLATPLGGYFKPELSPDGKWLAFTRSAPQQIWALELATNRLVRATNDSRDWANPRWAPTGQAIVANSTSEDVAFAVFQWNESGTFTQTTAFRASGTVSDWSRDGRHIIVLRNGDVVAYPVSPEGVPDRSAAGPQQITNTPSAESDARLSPDGRWVAYVSNESGRSEIYIESFPQRGVRVPVSKGGGIQPRWTRDSGQLLYFGTAEPDGRMMSVSVKTTGDRLELGAPRVIGPQPRQGYVTYMEREYTFNVAPDGRLLVQCSLAECVQNNSLPAPAAPSAPAR
jgi:Tol biopolymer transport system component